MAEDLLLGTCIEGIRIEPYTPGFEHLNIMAIANMKGPNAPKTNVVRSGMEMTTERDNMLYSIYTIYCDHVRDEINELNNKRGFSLTWSTQESRYILSPLLLKVDFDESNEYGLRIKNNSIFNPNLLMSALEKVPIFLIERNGHRRAVSSDDLRKESSFWTIDSWLFQSAEWIIREVPGEASLSNLINFLQIESLKLPNDVPLICGLKMDNTLDLSPFIGLEVDTINANRLQRRVDLRWVKIDGEEHWREIPEKVLLISNKLRNSGYYHRSNHQLWLIGTGNQVKVTGLDDEIGVHTCGIFLVRSDSWLGINLNHLLDQAIKSPSEEILEAAGCTFCILQQYFNYPYSGYSEDIEKPENEDYILQYLIDFQRTGLISSKPEHLANIINASEFSRLLYKSKFFDPSAWKRVKSD